MQVTKQDLLLLKSLEGWRQVQPRHIGDRLMSEEELTKSLQVCDAFWRHDGDLKRPHAVTTKGKCTNGFVDMLGMLQYPNLADIWARQLLLRIQDRLILDPTEVCPYFVIGSDHAGAGCSRDFARLINARTEFAEKRDEGEHKRQIWARKTVEAHELVLQIEELITTTATLVAVRQGIREGNRIPVRFAPVAGVLVHRSNTYEIEGDPIVHVVHYDIDTWEPADCPLCAAGSERLKPKQGDNWLKLTGRA